MSHILKLSFLLALLSMLSTSPLSAVADEKDGFQSLFNGKSLEGWSGDEKFWSVKEGTITGQTTKENPAPHNTFLIWNGGEIGDFELRLKFKIVGGNSGIQYRSEEKVDYV